MIGCEDRLRNDLYCVEWGVKLYSNQIKSTHDAKLYPQNGDRIVTIHSVTALRSMYNRSAVGRENSEQRKKCVSVNVSQKFLTWLE